ncbi:phosphate/phosphite/phosphonate ABC transporter substrate-binding protein [Nostoc sp. UHCC 0870]|uniref:phosphate/phosphite/phosphonate ABC transporter substrate-binding protein n=1 Tax=Nostoc sp. UHCC 0870 TaxID=2914041 RepID=UPI001EDD42B7|nr:phosphate/phosphite/phosphonate ABC transporter substrate-binding protein [Nostoc sp. UHCC 0870]UKO95802.1 phosphate/phosphite/phosphonate ABC transporter substrate-binding protein [Nostoc sp. UHCC 0870]
MKRRNLIKYSLLFIAGCTASNNSNTNINNQEAYSKFPKSLKFAVTDVTGIDDLKRDFGAFSTVLAEVLGINIELFPVENPTAAAPALLSGNLDLVFAGPSEYLILNSRAKAIPIISVKRKNYHSIFIVRADSNIKTLAQLKGKTIAMRKVGSTSGHIAPTSLLIDAGLDPKTDFKTVMLDNKGGKALKTGEVDAWSMSSDRYQSVLDSEGLSNKDFKIIFQGTELPSDVFVVSNQLASSFIETLRSQILKNQDKLIQSMVTANANRKYVGSQMFLANDADYNMIREVYKKIGQDSFLK